MKLKDLEIDVRWIKDDLFINNELYTKKEAYELAIKLLDTAQEILSYIDSRNIKD